MPVSDFKKTKRPVLAPPTATLQPSGRSNLRWVALPGLALKNLRLSVAVCVGWIVTATLVDEAAQKEAAFSDLFNATRCDLKPGKVCSRGWLIPLVPRSGQTDFPQ